MCSYPGVSGGGRNRVLTFFSLSLLLLGLLALPTSALPNPAPLSIFYIYTVNSTADPGDGTCDDTECTLREAIAAANADGDSSTIKFNIPHSDPGCDGVTCTITLASVLSPITADLTTIDGTTQAFYQGDTNPNGPEIVINGSPSHDCFYLWSAYSTIKGLVISGCDCGIEIQITAANGTHHNTVSGNYIGINAQGTMASGNHTGICIRSSKDNTIGGTTADARNIISGNQSHGIFIQGTALDPADNNMVYGNYIGTSADGTASVGNGLAGVWIGGGAHLNRIGGLTSGQRNTISGNGEGVHIAFAGSDNNRVEKNYIGTDATGISPLANTWEGVYIAGGAQNNEIRYNTIAYNGADGVKVDGSGTTGNRITRNSIHSNGGKGIALTNLGNGGISPPAITSANCTSGSGTGDVGRTIEIFSDLNGEGRYFEWWDQTTAGGSFSFLSNGLVFRYPMLTATATDSAGNTSEFSTPYPNGCQFNYLPLIMKNYEP